jgi:hypothetical protein
VVRTKSEDQFDQYTYQWLKFVSNFPRNSHLFVIDWSPFSVSNAAMAWFADLVNEDVYSANVEHVTISRE